MAVATPLKEQDEERSALVVCNDREGALLSTT